MIFLSFNEGEFGMADFPLDLYLLTEHSQSKHEIWVKVSDLLRVPNTKFRREKNIICYDDNLSDEDLSLELIRCFDWIQKNVKHS